MVLLEESLKQTKQAIKSAKGFGGAVVVRHVEELTHLGFNQTIGDGFDDVLSQSQMIRCAFAHQELPMGIPKNESTGCLPRYICVVNLSGERFVLYSNRRDAIDQLCAQSMFLQIGEARSERMKDVMETIDVRLKQYVSQMHESSPSVTGDVCMILCYSIPKYSSYVNSRYWELRVIARARNSNASSFNITETNACIDSKHLSNNIYLGPMMQQTTSSINGQTNPDVLLRLAEQSYTVADVDQPLDPLDLSSSINTSNETFDPEKLTTESTTTIAQFKHLRAKLACTMRTMNVLRDQRNSDTTEVTRIKCERDATKLEVVKLKQELAVNHAHMDKKQLKLEQQIERANKIVQDVRLELNHNLDNNKTLRQRVCKFDDVQEHNLQLKQQLDDEQSRTKTLQSELSSIKTTLDSKNSLLALAESSHTASNQRVGVLEAYTNSIEEHKMKLERKVTQNNADIARLRKQCTDFKAELTQKEAVLERTLEINSLIRQAYDRIAAQLKTYQSVDNVDSCCQTDRDPMEPCSNRMHTLQRTPSPTTGYSDNETIETSTVSEIEFVTTHTLDSLHKRIVALELDNGSWS